MHQWPDCSQLIDLQTAEVSRFKEEEYDVVLGMLERRLDGRTREDSSVRLRVGELLRSPDLATRKHFAGSAEGGRDGRTDWGSAENTAICHTSRLNPGWPTVAPPQPS